MSAGMVFYGADGEPVGTIQETDAKAIQEFLIAMGTPSLAQALDEALRLIAPESVTGNPSITYSPVTAKDEGVGLDYTDNTGKRKTSGYELRTLVARARIHGKVVTLTAERRVAKVHLSNDPDGLRKYIDRTLRNDITRAMIERAYP